ncbi:MAG: DUF4339 domain-containing protein [Acidobacteria bacterium]|nr:DUF4339 domain-containing protein [Acidobacteriota bacterium]
MAVYFYKDNQQLGPYEEEVVVGWLRAGTLTPEVMGIRTGETQWTKLGTLFPQAMPEPKPDSVVGIPPTAAISKTEPESRNTLWLKLLCGFCFLVALTVFLSATYYSYVIPTDSNTIHKYPAMILVQIIVRNIQIGTFLSGFFIILAILCAFKSTLIDSNQIRVGLRAVFVLVLLAGCVAILSGIGSYLTFRMNAETSPYEATRAYHVAENRIGPFRKLAVLGPLGVGVVIFGASGLFMTKRRRNP